MYNYQDRSIARADPEGGGGDRGCGPPLKNHKNIGLLSNTGSNSLKIKKLPSQHSMLGRYRHLAKRHLNCFFPGGSMMARL